MLLVKVPLFIRKMPVNAFQFIIQKQASAQRPIWQRATNPCEKSESVALNP
jgi:hypothetical protein